MKPSLLQHLACPQCEGALTAEQSDDAELISGELACAGCGAVYPIVRGVPQLLDAASLAQESTSRLYSDIWHSSVPEHAPERRSERGYDAPARSHLELLRLASGWEPVEPGIGIDAGCGSGGGTVGMARAHPDVHVVGVDLSEGPFTWADRARDLPNAHLVRGNLLAPPLARGRFDFAYSFGVLHHTPDPRRAFRLLLSRLRPGAKITIFLYKDFSDLPSKRFLLDQVNRLRRITTKMPPARLRRLARLCAPPVFLLLTLPARGLRALGLGRLVRHVPYGTFPSLASVASSLEDRFGAPYEFRFSSADLQRWIEEEGLEEGRVVDCLPWGFSGLVLAGRRGRD